MSPKISVIVPVFNTEKYLRRCIDSILSQTFTDFELLLIDDGSKDDSPAICDEYALKDNRIRVFHKENGGVSTARNLGLDNAKGEWITFADSDDLMSSNALELYVEAIKDTIPDIVRGGYIKYFNDGTTQEITCKYSFDVIDKAEMLDIMERTIYYGFLWNSLYRRKKICSIRFDEDISWCEDHLFSILCYNNCHVIRYIPDIVYRYRVNTQSSLSYPTDPIMIANVANREIRAKFVMFGDEAITSHETWQIYYDKMYKALNIALLGGYKSFCVFYKKTRNKIIYTPSHPCNKNLLLFSFPWLPRFVKYAVLFYKILAVRNTPNYK